MNAKKPAYLPNHGAPGVKPFDLTFPVGMTGMRIPSWRMRPVSTAFVSTNAATRRSSPIMLDLTAPAGAVVERPVIRMEEPMFARSRISRVTSLGTLAVVPTPNWPSMRPPYPMHAGDPNIPRAARPVPIAFNVRPQGGVLAGVYGDAASATVIAHVQGAFAQAAKEQPSVATTWNARRVAAPSRYAGRSTQDAVGDALHLLQSAGAYKAWKALSSYYNAVVAAPLPAVVRRTSAARKVTGSPVVTTKTGLGWREVSAPGGYTYRQYKSGDIVVRSGPALVGQRIKQTSDSARWNAITNEIGSWSTYKSAKTRSRGSGFDVDTVTQILSAVAAGVGGSSAAAAEPVYEEPAAVASGDSSKLLLYGGAGLIGVLGLGLVVNALRKS